MKKGSIESRDSNTARVAVSVFSATGANADCVQGGLKAVAAWLFEEVGKRLGEILLDTRVKGNSHISCQEIKMG